MRFPVTIKHRTARVKIYAPGPKFPSYRLYYRANGKALFRGFATYGEARKAAERIARELASGSAAPTLSTRATNDARTALERLDDLFRATGRRVSLLAAVSEFAEAASQLRGRPLAEAVEGYLRTVASVKRKDIGEAVEEFLQAHAPLAQAAAGQRAQLSGKYAYNREIQLRKFAAAFPNHAVCDLTKEHLDAFAGALGEFSAKTRNHHRAAIRQFLQWAVRKDYLPAAHRMNEADGMRPERANTAEVSFYTPKELRALLENAEGPLRAMLALGGLAGLRTAELLRLDWADVWRVPGHIEITAGKAKTRARRLVEVCPALAAWLEPFRACASGKLWELHEITFQEHFGALCEQTGVPRKTNGLRHAFCTYHFALHANENLTAAQAGNSPAMIHAHYKGLATNAQAAKWFAVKPATLANVLPLPATA